MSPLAKLKAVVASYHQKTPVDLTENYVDLFLVAANNAVRNAQLKHNFELSRVRATLDIAGASGVSLDTATIVAGTATGGLREIVSLGWQNNAGYILPMEFTRKDVAMARDRDEVNKGSEYWTDIRYPSDADYLSRSGSAVVVQSGRILSIYPTNASNTGTTTLYIDGYGTLPEYTATHLTDGNEYADFLMTYGSSYLQWETIIEMNYLFATFVARQEGNLAAPEKARDIAWNNLVSWDSYLIDSNSSLL